MSNITTSIVQPTPPVMIVGNTNGLLASNQQSYITFNAVGSVDVIKYVDCGEATNGSGCTGKKRGKYKKESFKIQVGNNMLESVGRTATLSSIATILSNLKEGEQANILIQRT